MQSKLADQRLEAESFDEERRHGHCEREESDHDPAWKRRPTRDGEGERQRKHKRVGPTDPGPSDYCPPFPRRVQLRFHLPGAMTRWDREIHRSKHPGDHPGDAHEDHRQQDECRGSYEERDWPVAQFSDDARKVEPKQDEDEAG